VNRRVISWALLLALSAGCGKASAPVELQVGEQRISVVIPEGWEHLDYGDHHLLRQDLAAIAIRQIGGSPSTGPRRLGEDAQRDIASRTSLQIGDREAVVIDTWDRLSHQWRKRFCFVRGKGPLLAIFMMQGEFEDLQPVFDELIASVVLPDSLPEAQPQ
jgi:hypothetical protein